MDTTPFRNMGPRGLDAFIEAHGSGPSPHLDAVCAQFAAHGSLLYWFTDLEAAKREASRERKPILSLRLLGRLDEELSCANSRFFRTLLYPLLEVRRVLANDFVLHWESVRPVPKVTIELGGRRIVRTLTGNSLHAVLDWYGRPADALLGMMSPAAFVSALEEARDAALAIAPLADVTPKLAEIHARRRREPRAPTPGHAVRASMIAPTKHVIEAPLLAAVMPRTVEDDTRIAQDELHPRLSRAFERPPWRDASEMVDWIYRELFLMPPDDPWLGLDVEDVTAPQR